MITLRIDGRPVTVAEGATILDAARALGIAIPTLCHLGGCTPQTSCLACVVGVGTRGRLVPSCATAASEGLEVDSSSATVRAARRTAMELLLGEHLGECLAPCESICPTGCDLPEVLRLAAAGRRAEAATLLESAQVLPAVLGRICPAPCERGCRRSTLDGPVAVRASERALADGDHPLPAAGVDSGRTVAVVGAGPAGLAAAFHLRRTGHRVELYERADHPGGGLRHGPGDAALPPAVLAAAVQRVLDMGVALRCAAPLADAAALARLRSGCDAVVLALGAAGAGSLPGWAGEPPAGVFVAAAGQAAARQAVRAVAAGAEAARAVAAYFGAAPGPARRWAVRRLRGEAGWLAAHQAEADARCHDGCHDGGAARCLGCGCDARDTCALRRWSAEYGAEPERFRTTLPAWSRDDSHPLLTFEPGRCIACGLCVQIAGDAGEPLGLAMTGRGPSLRVAVPFGGALRDALTRSAAACADACPTGALARRQP